MRKSGAAAVAALALALTAGAALAQGKPEVLVKQRQAKMLLQGKYFGELAAMAQGKVPYNAEVVKRDAIFLDNLSQMAWDGFDPSTKGVKSRAKPELFDNMAEVKQAISRFENEAHKLYELSQKGDEAAVKAQVRVVFKACSGCHDKFRQEQ